MNDNPSAGIGKTPSALRDVMILTALSDVLSAMDAALTALADQLGKSAQEFAEIVRTATLLPP